MTFLGYKIGQFKIPELRDLAEKELANNFGIRGFYTQILVNGALPMPILKQNQTLD